MYQGLDYIPPGIVCPEKGHKLEKLHINKWAEAETEKEQPEVSGLWGYEKQTLTYLCIQCLGHSLQPTVVDIQPVSVEWLLKFVSFYDSKKHALLQFCSGVGGQGEQTKSVPSVPWPHRSISYKHSALTPVLTCDGDKLTWKALFLDLLKHPFCL